MNHRLSFSLVGKLNSFTKKVKIAEENFDTSFLLPSFVSFIVYFISVW